MTQQEIADELGITKARVGQIEAAALRKLRRALVRRGVDSGVMRQAVNWWGDGERGREPLA
ncbi:MAG TPA: sigma factor-like helix-turn-helix DNA-binding protein [Polyangiales bacterium]|nr:sigma factor-like helix-turn-helix DNA-binding protein [Polyangiales bacterium]